MVECGRWGVDGGVWMVGCGRWDVEGGVCRWWACGYRGVDSKCVDGGVWTAGCGPWVLGPHVGGGLRLGGAESHGHHHLTERPCPAGTLSFLAESPAHSQAPLSPRLLVVP